MSAEVRYEIARYRRAEHSDGLIDRHRVIRRADGSLAVSSADGRECPCPQRGVDEVIAADPALHRVNPIEVTEVQGSPEVLDGLPLLLRVADEGHPPESYEVLVGDEPWDVLETTDGLRLVPDGYLIADRGTLPEPWVQIDCADAPTPKTCVERLGLVTPAVVAAVAISHSGDQRLTVTARGDDVETVVDWLRRDRPGAGWPAETLLRHFADAAQGRAIDGSSGWSMTLSLGAEVVRGVLDRVQTPR